MQQNKKEEKTSNLMNKCIYFNNNSEQDQRDNNRFKRLTYIYIYILIDIYT